MNELETLEYLRVSVFNLPFSFSECVCVCVCVCVCAWVWVCECVCPNNTDLVEAALGNGLQQLIGFLRFMPGNNTCRLCGQGLATHQHHNIYCFLEEHYLSVFILERKKKRCCDEKESAQEREEIECDCENPSGSYFPTQFPWDEFAEYNTSCS